MNTFNQQQILIGNYQQYKPTKTTCSTSLTMKEKQSKIATNNIFDLQKWKKFMTHKFLRVVNHVALLSKAGKSIKWSSLEGQWNSMWSS